MEGLPHRDRTVGTKPDEPIRLTLNKVDINP